MKARASFAVLVLLLLLRATTRGQSGAETLHLYLPVMQSAGTSSIGLALTNPTLEPVEVRLTARSYKGEIIAGSGISNPSTVILPSRGQRALQLTEIFGAGISQRAGWIDLTSSAASVQGLFILFDDALSAIDGGSFTETVSGRLIFPKVTANTTITFINTSSKPISKAAFRLFDRGGRLPQEKLLTLDAYSGFSGSLSDLIPDAEGFSGYAELDTAGTILDSRIDALVGFATYRNRADVAAVAALPSDTGVSRSGYIAHFVSHGGYYTNFGLVNPGSQAQRVRITAAVDESTVSVERTIPPTGSLEERADDLFGFTGAGLITGSIRYEVQDEGNGLAAYAEYGTIDGLLLTAVAAQGKGLSDIIFSQIAEGGGFYTGLALLNPNVASSSVTIDAFDREGLRIASAAVTIEAGARRTRLIRELFPSITNLTGGYLHVTASRGIVASELFGSSNSPNVLANVPARGVQLRAQGSDRPVVASQGAYVVSADGQASVMIPPGALATDMPIGVEAIPYTDLSNPTPDLRIAGAVELRPSGLHPAMPLKVMFPLAVQLPAGTSLPVLFFNPQTRLYETTEFTALVGESGRTAFVDVTHFSSFVVSVPNLDLIKVNGISPSSGTPGTIVTIDGEGFSTTANQNEVWFAGVDNTSRPSPVTAASARTLTASVPAGAVTGYVTVRMGGRSSLGVLFTVPERPRPTVSSISPDSTFSEVPVEFEIAGTGFRPESRVTYDDVVVASSYVDTTLLVYAPEAAQLKPGVHRIAVMNPGPGGGVSNVVEFRVTNPQPVLSSVTPESFVDSAFGFVTFNGAGFIRDSQVMIDGSAVQPVFVGPKMLRVAFSAFRVGSHSVEVSNLPPGGGLSRSLTVAARRPTEVAGIRLIDSASGSPVREVVVNVGNTVQANVQVFDSAGTATQGFVPTFTSLDTAVATADGVGNIQGVSPGFSTLVVSAGSALATFTITVVGVNEGKPGNAVTGVAQDFAGRVYFAATGNHAILRSDDVTTSPSVYAGISQSPGLRNDVRLASLFRSPAFLVLNHADGSLYVADAANNVIRRVSPGSSGRVDTLAGTGAPGGIDGAALGATFNNPQGVALDGKGFLWIADSGNHTIRRIDLASGTVQTVAGQSGVSGFQDGQGTGARFKDPVGLAVEVESDEQHHARERAGLPPSPVRVIVADSGNGTIRRVTENGDVETVQGSVTSALGQGGATVAYASGFTSPTGVAVDPFGNIYVSEASAGTVKTILTNGDIVSAVQPGTLSQPRGIAITEAGRVVVADSNRAAQRLEYGEPEISTITPGRVPNTGNIPVTVTGRNFAPGSVVLVGGVIIPQMTVETTQLIRFMVPALPSGITTVTVENRGGIAQRSWIVDPLPLAQLPAGRITTVAGGATFIGDGTEARSASLLPWKAVADKAGNFYVVDYLHNRVRRINAATGIITTVAGTGVAGFSGDGGLATAATLNGPQGLAIDVAGNVFIADAGNHRVRKLSAASGILNTVAGTGVSGFGGDGGPAVNASLSLPADVAVNSAGNLIILDAGNNRIRQVGLNGQIGTIAGNGLVEYGIPADNVPATTAAMNFPQAVAVDALDSVYVADTYTHTIRKITSNGNIHTIAGTGSAGSSGLELNQPAGLAVDASGNVFIADSGNNRIRKLDAVNGAVSTIAGTGQNAFGGDGGAATLAKLNYPLGLTLDATGNLFVADALNLRLRKIHSLTNVITTVAGTGSAGYLGDPTPATAAGLNYPQGIAFDSFGNLYVADSNRIRRIAAGTGIITTIAGTGQQGFASNGALATQAALSNPSGIVVDAAGDILFADTGSNRILKIAAGTGTLSTIAGTGAQGFLGDTGPATSATLDGPLMLALDSSKSNLYFSDGGNHRIRKVNLTTGVIMTVAGNGSAGSAGDGGQASAAELNYPFGVALDAADNLFISERLNGIRRVASSTGIITTFAGINSFGFGGDGGPATQAMLNYPLGLAFDNQGNLFFADAGNARIRRISSATNTIATVAGNGLAGSAADNVPAVSSPLEFPIALQFDANGNLFFTDRSSVAARIRAVKAPIP